jgi:O-antigen/teichoic acid export membrane protein
MMPAETFGQFKVVMAVIGVVSGFCLLGTSQAAVMSASNGADGNLVPLLREKLLANIGGAVVILGGAAYYAWARDGSGPVALGLLFAAMLFPLYNTSDIWMSWLNGKSEFGILATGRIITAVLTLSAVLSVGLIGVVDLWIVIVIFVSALGVQNAFMLREALKHRSGMEKDPTLVRYGRRTSLALSVSGLLALDVVMLDHYFKPGDVAIYVVALLFPDQIKAIFSIVNQTISPRMFRATNLPELWANFRREFWVLTLGFSLIGVIGFFLLPIVTTLLFSDKYAAAAEYGKWLWLTFGLVGSPGFLGIALTARHSLIPIYASSVIYPICLGTLYFYWVDEGIKGMIAARVLAACGLAAIYVSAFTLHLRRETHCNV